MIHHTVHKKVNHSTARRSGVTGVHASEATRRARAPGRTDMLVRAMGITRAEVLSDRDHTVWEVKEPATAKQPTCLVLL